MKSGKTGNSKTLLNGLQRTYLSALSYETTQTVILLAKARRLEEEAEVARDPRIGSNGEIGFFEFLLNGPGPKRAALQDMIEFLSGREKDELLALMWIGRAAAGEKPAMWSRLVADARGHDPSENEGYIMSKSPLDLYLVSGLARLGL